LFALSIRLGASPVKHAKTQHINLPLTLPSVVLFHLHLRHPLDKMMEKLSVEECQAHIKDIRNSHGADPHHESENFLRGGFERTLKT
jgi:hypothetical protein